MICDILQQKAGKSKKEYKTKNLGNAEHCCGVIVCIAASEKKKYISDDLCNAKQIALNFSILFLNRYSPKGALYYHPRLVICQDMCFSSITKQTYISYGISHQRIGFYDNYYYSKPNTYQLFIYYAFRALNRKIMIFSLEQIQICTHIQKDNPYCEA